MIAGLAAAGSGLTTAATVASAVTAGATGITGYQAAKGEQLRADVNSYIGRTRAIQTGEAAGRNLNSELAQVRTALGANQQRPNVGVFEVLNEIRTTRDRDRRIEVGNRMSEAADWRIQSQNAKSAARGSLWQGIGKAAPSIFDLYQLRTT